MLLVTAISSRKSTKLPNVKVVGRLFRNDFGNVMNRVMATLLRLHYQRMRGSRQDLTQVLHSAGGVKRDITGLPEHRTVLIFHNSPSMS